MNLYKFQIGRQVRYGEIPAAADIISWFKGVTVAFRHYFQTRITHYSTSLTNFVVFPTLFLLSQCF